MQASLRKKMKEHFSSKAHKLCVKREEYHACDAITKSIDKMNERYIASTCRVFIQSTVRQKDVGHFPILKMRLNFK